MTSDAVPLPGYPEPYDLLAAILLDGTVEWRLELWDTDIKPETMTWRPRPGGPSMGAIILHMIVAELFWFEKCALGQPLSDEDRKSILCDEIDVDAGIWPDPPYEPLSWYVQLQDGYRARTLEALKRWAPADTLVEGPDRQCSLRWIFGHVIQHESYHGGQIVMLYHMWKAANATSLEGV